MQKNFEFYLTNILGFASSSAICYVKVVNNFELFLKKYHPKIKIINAKNKHIATFIQNKSPASKNRIIIALKKFYEYLILNEIITQTPVKNFNYKPILPKFNRCASEQDIEKLINIPNRKDPITIRDKAMLEVFYGTGIRLAEISHLKLSDYDKINKTLKINGKGSKQRIIPLLPKTSETIDLYLTYRTKLLISPNISCEYLFIKKNCNGKKMNHQLPYKRLKLYVKKAGLSNKLTTHSLRHSFATHLINAGANLRVVQALLGHSSISTTQIYTHLEDKKLQLLHQKYHPRA